MNKSIQDKLNSQITHELFSSNFYLQLSALFDELGYKGFSKKMFQQSDEERNHALKIYNYLLDCHSQVKLETIDKPNIEVSDPLDGMQQAYMIEKNNTSKINDLFQLCRQENDYATEIFLQWFIKEQVEEEEWALNYIDLLKIAGDNKSAIFLIDKELLDKS